MPRIKALQILSVLNKDEFSKFSQYIASPYFNRSKDLLKLFNFVKKFYAEFPEEKISSEKIYKKIYPGKKYNEGTMRNLFSDLGNLAEKFLGYVVYEGSQSFNYNTLLEMNCRDLPKFFIKHYEKSREANNINADDTGLKNLYSHLLDSELSDFNIRRSNHKDEPEMKSAESLLIYLIKFFLLKNSNVIAEKVNRNIIPDYNVVQDFFENTDTEKLINIIEGNNPEEGKRLKLEFYMKLAAENKDNDFLKYLNLSLENFRAIENELSDREKFGVYVSISNIINDNMKSLDIDLKQLLFDFKKEMVEKGFTTEMFGKISIIDFITVIDAALNVKQTGWARNYIETKIKFLEENMKPDLYNFNMARVLFIEKKFEESNEYFAKVRQDSTYFKVDIKVNRMKNFYELGYLETAFSQAEAFRQFLKRSDIISDKRNKSYSNFLKFYVSLLKRKTGMTDTTLLKKELEACGSIRSKGWLLEKIEELG
ncbi:MAG: hypothetical protein K1X86_07850 [Ignavibacteria bacterium]|nr:hypothetical protein [Ignavibacteria bacterium]